MLQYQSVCSGGKGEVGGGASSVPHEVAIVKFDYRYRNGIVFKKFNPKLEFEVERREFVISRTDINCDI